MNETNNHVDDLETMIILALDANHNHAVSYDSGMDRGKNDSVEKCILRDQGELLKIGEMKPASSFTFDMSGDNERIFSTSPDYLVAHPADIIGDESETICLHDGLMKWTGLRRSSKPPRGVVALGKPSHWYEMHYRVVSLKGGGAYRKRFVPLDAKGRPLPAKIQGQWICAPEAEGASLIIAASMIEDSYRAGSMLVSIKDATEIKFPVALDAYKEIFALRDGPIAGNRRKAILHWVRRHLRASHKANVHSVKKHTRGVSEFVMGGMRFRIDANDGEKLTSLAAA